jgi:AcrR family transcriptional regulator
MWGIVVTGKMTKGERTRQRILDAAEGLFGESGYDNTSLRDVAERVGIKEPGIYNHFRNKEALYRDVLTRALQPLADVISETLNSGLNERVLQDLPGKITDLLSEHPAMPGLFHQALSGKSGDAGQVAMEDWLQRLFAQGESLWEALSVDPASDHKRITLKMIMMFNAVTGYFLSQKILDQAQMGSVLDPENLAAQKQLMAGVMQVFADA